MPDQLNPDIPPHQVLAWGERRRAYDLAHPFGEHETVIDGETYSSRPAFLSDLIVPNDQGKRPDQVAFSELVTRLCFGVLGILLIGWGLLAWVTR